MPIPFVGAAVGAIGRAVASGAARVATTASRVGKVAKSVGTGARGAVGRRKVVDKLFGKDNNPLRAGGPDFKQHGYLNSPNLTNTLYNLDTIGRFKDRAENTFFPQFHHAITVSVQGGPNATMTRTWQLACALAFGQYRHAVGFYGGYSLDTTWDITGKAVRLSIYYDLSYQADLGARTFFRRGPITATVGGEFPTGLLPGGALVAGGQQIVGAFIGGKPDFRAQALNAQAALQLDVAGLGVANIVGGLALGPSYDLPDSGRLILTEYKGNADVQPPAPTDYTSLVSAVSAALVNPGYLPASPPEDGQQNPPFGNSNGVYIYPPNSRPSLSYVNGKLKKFFDPVFKIVYPQVAAVGRGVRNLIGQGISGIDGYKIDNPAQPIKARGPDNAAQ